MAEPRTVHSGLGYPESPRWQDGRLFFVDLLTRRVQSRAPAGALAEHGYLPGQPSAVGFRPDGELLAVSSYDRKLLRLRDGSPTVVADLTLAAGSPLNDLAVAADGTAYVGALGLETAYRPHDEVGDGVLIAVRPDGTVRVVADRLATPNGIAVQGSTLIVAETRGRRLTAFDVDADGALSGRRVFADCGDRMPDGIASDAAGAVWVGCPFSAEFVRVAEGGEVLDVLPTPGRWAIACTFGGPDRAELWCTTAVTSRPDLFRGRAEGFIEVARVAVPGAP